MTPHPDPPVPVPAASIATLLGPPPARERSAWLSAGLTRLVSEGRVPLDARLPSERSLAETLGLSRGTVVRSLDELAERGLVVGRQGSGRTVRLPPSATRPVESLGARTTAAPPGDIDLRATVNTPHPLLPEVAARVAARIAEDHSRGSTPADGLPELVDAVCRHYERRGFPTAPSQVIITGGAVSAMHLALLAVTSTSERVGTENPTYPNTVRVITGAHRRIVPLETGAVGLGATEDVLASGSLAAAVLTPDFTNPTGALLDEAARRRVARAARRGGTALLIDETLAGMNWRGLRMPPPMPAAEAGGSAPVVHIGSVAKTLWAGLRIGWIRTSTALADEISRNRLGTDLGAAVLSQRITAELLDELSPDGVPIIGPRLAAQHDALDGALRASLGHWHGPTADGGLSLWREGLRSDAMDLVARARARGLHITPGRTFSPLGRGWDHAIRIPFSAPVEDLLRAVEILADLDG